MIQVKNAVWMLDLDGVIWRGKTAIAGSAQAVEGLRSAGVRVLFVSNNSSLDVESYLAKLRSVGIDAPAVDLCTSAMAAAQLVKPGSRAMVLGGKGIHEALLARGVDPVDALVSEAIGVDAVVVGLDRQLSYDRLTAAVRAVLGGAELIVTNDDPTFPAEDGLNAGGGSIGAAVAYASSTTPMVAGKPHPAMATLILDRVGVVPAIMVGDQPITDGALAEVMGIPFGLVLSGVATSSDGVVPAPTLVAQNLAELVSTVLAS